MESVRVKFVERFGEEEAIAIENAAISHENGVHDRRGSDPFKWALTICIGYQCFEIDGYRDCHGIKALYEDIKQWIKDHGELSSHDGDCDFLALMCGTYVVMGFIVRRRGE